MMQTTKKTNNQPTTGKNRKDTTRTEEKEQEESDHASEVVVVQVSEMESRVEKVGYSIFLCDKRNIKYRFQINQISHRRRAYDSDRDSDHGIEVGVVQVSVIWSRVDKVGYSILLYD
jgi:hypothetical protein